MCPANERWRYNVTSSFIGWAHIQNDPCKLFFWNIQHGDVMHGNASHITGFCEGNPQATFCDMNPPVASGFPSQRVSVVELWYFIVPCFSNKLFNKQKLELLMIWDALILCHYNGSTPTSQVQMQSIPICSWFCLSGVNLGRKELMDTNLLDDWFS